MHVFYCIRQCWGALFLPIAELSACLLSSGTSEQATIARVVIGGGVQFRSRSGKDKTWSDDK